MKDPITVLDHGFVRLVDSLGSDLAVVNAARVSFHKQSEEFGEKDAKLLNYLAVHQHWSPFRHVYFTFHCKVPEFIARQWYKHVVGIAYTEGGAACVDHGWNEVSQRYTDVSDFDFYVPGHYRQQSASNKQGSTDALLTFFDDPQEGIVETIRSQVGDHVFNACSLYERMIALGVAREQARMVLPLNIYTEFYWTASLQAVVNFIKLRKHEGSQWEIRQYADAVEAAIMDVVPVSTKALLGVKS